MKASGALFWTSILLTGLFLYETTRASGQGDDLVIYVWNNLINLAMKGLELIGVEAYPGGIVGGRGGE